MTDEKRYTALAVKYFADKNKLELSPEEQELAVSLIADTVEKAKAKDPDASIDYAGLLNDFFGIAKPEEEVSESLTEGVSIKEADGDKKEEEPAEEPAPEEEVVEMPAEETAEEPKEEPNPGIFSDEVLDKNTEGADEEKPEGDVVEAITSYTRAFLENTHGEIESISAFLNSLKELGVEEHQAVIQIFDSVVLTLNKQLGAAQAIIDKYAPAENTAEFDAGKAQAEELLNSEATAEETPAEEQPTEEVVTPATEDEIARSEGQSEEKPAEEKPEGEAPAEEAPVEEEPAPEEEPKKESLATSKESKLFEGLNTAGLIYDRMMNIMDEEYPNTKKAIKRINEAFIPNKTNKAWKAAYNKWKTCDDILIYKAEHNK